MECKDCKYANYKYNVYTNRESHSEDSNKNISNNHSKLIKIPFNLLNMVTLEIEKFSLFPYCDNCINLQYHNINHCGNMVCSMCHSQKYKLIKSTNDDYLSFDLIQLSN